jgi:hypothetical protein
MAWTYRNTNTGDVVTFDERSARLDALPHRWVLVEAPAAAPVDDEDEPELAEPERPRPARRKPRPAA